MQGDGAGGMVDTKSVIELIEQEGIQTVDFRFTDLRGRWQHLSYAAAKVDERVLQEGIMFDGSAVPGWRDASESDMVLIPELASAVTDPFSAQPTLLLIANVAEPGSGLGYERCPRSIAATAVTHLEGSGIADEVRTATEMAFSVFDNVQSDVRASEAFWRIDAEEGSDSSGTRFDVGNAGHRFSSDAPYAVPPADHLADLRAEIVSMLQTMGLEPQHQHHSPSQSQCRISLAARPMLASADSVQIYRYVVHNVANSYGKTATFMAKPLAFALGAGFEIQQALWRNGKPVFAGHGYADLSEACLHFIGGILQHAHALNAFTNPTTNSYRRLTPGQSAPRHLAYAAFNRSAAVRLPFAARPEEKRVELRFPDPSANAYLASAAILMAGLDGIARQIDPGEPMDRNLYDLPQNEIEEMPTVCRTLDEALKALDRDRAFLTKGEVFSDAVIDAYITLKKAEIEALEAVPHPVEYQLYYSV